MTRKYVKNSVKTPVVVDDAYIDTYDIHCDV